MLACERSPGEIRAEIDRKVRTLRQLEENARLRTLASWQECKRFRAERQALEKDLAEVNRLFHEGTS